MHETLKVTKKDFLAMPDALKNTVFKDGKKEVFVQTEAETGAKDVTITSV